VKVDFYKHNIGPAEIERMVETLGSTFLTTGPRTRAFEAQLQDYLGVAHAIGVSSWTTGAFITLKAMGVSPGDEVITTPMTFISSANVIVHCGATPVFVDVEPATGNIDVSLIEAAITDRTVAILPVHLYGQMVDMKAIADIADRHGLKVLEDSAHCIEGSRDGVRPGALGTAAAFSFYATKNITSGEGGAVVTNDDELAAQLFKYRLHGMSAGVEDRYHSAYRHWDMELLGYKANMSDVQAALLGTQLDRLDETLERKEEISSQYERAFAESPYVEAGEPLSGSVHARHISTIRVAPSVRDEMLLALQEAEIGVAVNFRAIHLLSYYRETFGYEPGAYPIAEKFGESTLTLPMYPKLTDDQVDYVIDTVLTESERLTLMESG
jgi:dTDP-4-amino-4,6-dideoxygalactose transaminase